MSQDDTSEVKIVGGAAGTPRRPASPVAAIRAKSPATPASAGSGSPEAPEELVAAPMSRGDRGGGSHGRPGTFNPLLAVSGFLGVLVLVFGLAWGFDWGHGHTEKVTLSAGSKPVRQMSSVARAFVHAFTNYDPDSIDAAYNQIRLMATGDFETRWPTLLPDNVRQQLRANRAQIRGEIRNFFVQDFTGTSGEVYVVSDVTYANNKRPQPVPDTLRFDIHLRKVDGNWKISQVDLLNSPTAGAALAGTGSGSASGSPPTTAG